MCYAPVYTCDFCLSQTKVRYSLNRSTATVVLAPHKKKKTPKRKLGGPLLGLYLITAVCEMPHFQIQFWNIYGEPTAITCFLCILRSLMNRKQKTPCQNSYWLIFYDFSKLLILRQKCFFFISSPKFLHTYYCASYMKFRARLFINVLHIWIEDFLAAIFLSLSARLSVTLTVFLWFTT